MRDKVNQNDEVVETNKGVYVSYFLAILLGIVLNLVFSCFFGFSKVSGQSMSPTLKNNDIIFVVKQTVYDNFKSNDIISFKSNYRTDAGKQMSFVKRIIAKEGQTIEITENKVFVDSVLLDEDYLSKDIITYGDISLTVPPNTYYVMGDNREHSMDSRDFTVGLIDKSSINGKTYSFMKK